MKLGLALPHYDTSFAGGPASWGSVVRLATLAERAGFDSVWVSDHLFLDWGKYGGPSTRQGSLECWTTLSGIAGATQSIRVGALTLCNDLRAPGLVAKMAASLATVCPGRVEVGLGAGWYEPEYEAAALHFDRPGIRIARLQEAVEIVTRLVRGDPLDFDGDHYTLDGAVCRPVPDAPPAVWVGGKGDRLLEAAAHAADGWNFSWIGSMQAYRDRVEAAERACERVARSRPLRRSVGAYVLVGRDDRDVARRFERLAAVSPPGIVHGGRGGAGVSWDEYQQKSVSGSVTEVTDRLGDLADLGVEEVIVTLGALPFQLADEEDVELLGSTVAAALR